MRRPGADESRQLLFQEAAIEAQNRERREQGPSPAERHGMRMVVEGLGLKNTDAVTPAIRQLHQEFVRNTQDGPRVARALERTQATPPGIARSGQRFIMERDWDKKED